MPEKNKSVIAETKADIKNGNSFTLCYTILPGGQDMLVESFTESPVLGGVVVLADTFTIKRPATVTGNDTISQKELLKNYELKIKNYQLVMHS